MTESGVLRLTNPREIAHQDEWLWEAVLWRQKHRGVEMGV